MSKKIRMSKCDKLTETILNLHKEYFLPLQYTKKELTPEDGRDEIIPVIRIHNNNGVMADVIIWNGNGEGHEFIDGNYYYDGDGVGEGKTLTKALENLLKKTRLSIKRELT